MPLILTDDRKAVDVDQTTSLLQRASYASGAQNQRTESASNSRFEAIGKSIDVFEYHDVIYLSAFEEVLSNDARGRLLEPERANNLDVFVRKNHRTHLMCRLLLKGADFPTIYEPE
jgi:hypothetical protein